MIEIYVHYYISKDGKIILELKRTIQNPEEIKIILKELYDKGVIPAVVKLKSYKSKVKIEKLLKKLSD